MYFFVLNTFTNILSDENSNEGSYEKLLNDLNKISEKEKDKEKEFILPKTDNEVQDIDTSLKNMSTSFNFKKIKKYYSPIQGIHFLGIDSIDITRFIIDIFKQKFKKQITIDLVGIYWRYRIFCGVDGGLRYDNIKMEDQILKKFFPFVNISFGFLLATGRLFKISIGTCKYYDKNLKTDIYPLWWTVTPICFNMTLFKINDNLSIMLRIEILFKRLISIDFFNIKTNFKTRNKDKENKDIPFFGETSRHNIKNTYFGIQIFIELLYTPKIEKIDL